jgi:hypothetical protein
MTDAFGAPHDSLCLRRGDWPRRDDGPDERERTNDAPVTTETRYVAMPPIVSREGWEAARDALMTDL